MDAQQLIDRLEERATEIPVGPPPVALMRARARRHRQGRVAILASAAAVAAIAGGLAWQGGGGADDGSRTPNASDAPADPDTPADGFRYVGIGDVVAAVPQDWATNKTDCGTPQADTVVIDQGVTCLALVPRPADVDSLAIQPTFDGLDTAGWTRIEVAGQEALRSPVSRQDGVVRQTVVVPDRDVSFVAESSSADGASVVADLLDGITLLREHTTVPAFQDLGYDADPAPMVDAYVDRLAELGVAAEVAQRNGRGLDAGTVLGTDPAVGSVVAPGDTVRVSSPAERPLALGQPCCASHVPHAGPRSRAPGPGSMVPPVIEAGAGTGTTVTSTPVCSTSRRTWSTRRSTCGPARSWSPVSAPAARSSSSRTTSAESTGWLGTSMMRATPSTVLHCSICPANSWNWVARSTTGPGACSRVARSWATFAR